MDILKENIYTSYIKKNIARVLTQVDRDKDSKTYGSCDRNYWHLKIRDFSSAILQQTCLTMALLYKVDFAGNVFYSNENVKKWAIAALKYLKKIQLKDGSFNEYYPNEHGFPPTAFALFAASKTYRELNLNDSEILEMLDKAAEWLSGHQETKAYNQEIAAIAGLYSYYMITKKTDVLDAVNSKIESVLKIQSDEGWFPEQGGADIGYSSVAFDMLTEYFNDSKDERVLEPIKKLLDFLSYFVHPDGTIGGEYGSRNTIYFMPNGLETYIALGLDSDNRAQSMIQMIYKENPQSDFGDFMDAVDERYLTHYVMHSYLRALQKFHERAEIPVSLPFNTVHKRNFSDAGLMTFFNGSYFTVVSAKKGGLIKAYKGRKEVFYDCGYRIPVKVGTTATTNWLDKAYEIVWKNEGCQIKGKFNLITPKVQNPIYHLGLRVSALFMGDKVNKLVKKLTIFQDKHFDAEFNRKVILNDNSIVVEDNIKNPLGYEVEEAGNVSLRLVASGKFFSRSDILKTEYKQLGTKKEISLKKIFKFDTENLEIIE